MTPTGATSSPPAPPAAGAVGSESLGTVAGRGILSDNPVLAHALGVCSALAVTSRMDATLTMCAALLFVAAGSTFLVSLLRRVMPRRTRLMVQMLCIATLVIVVDLYLRAHHAAMSRALGPYVALIVTNCIILGRCEAFALRHGPLRSAVDGAGHAMGYALTLLAVALIREPLGSGTLLGYRVLPESYQPAALLATAPGAFLVMGVLIWIVRSVFPSLGRQCGGAQEALSGARPDGIL